MSFFLVYLVVCVVSAGWFAYLAGLAGAEIRHDAPCRKSDIVARDMQSLPPLAEQQKRRLEKRRLTEPRAGVSEWGRAQYARRRPANA